MDCRDRPVLPGRKLVQARLPFKRLNLAPKEKVGDALQCEPAGGADPTVEPSLDNLENDCPSSSDLDLRPRLINGRGPLDSFLTARLKPSAGVVVIDLTEEDSNQSPPRAPHAKTTHAAATGPGTLRRPVMQPEKDVAKPPVAIMEPPGSEDQEVRHPAKLGRTLGFRENAPQRCPELRDRPRPYLTKDPPSWSEAMSILFQEKVPVVVLEDILAPKPAWAGSPPMVLLDRGSSSDSDAPESCPEDCPSCLPASSPKGPPVAPAHSHGTSPTSTPICNITKKPTRGSTEKGRTQLHRDLEHLQQEVQRAREEAREEVRRKKEEERELRDRKRRQRQEKEEKEKAEKQRLKEERRRERQEALEAKLEEKRKKEEEKRLREEEKRIKAEKAEITRFFQKPKTPQAPKTLAGSCGKFAPFEIKEHMILAPRCRASLDQDLCAQLDRLLQVQEGPSAFLSELKGRGPLTWGPTRGPDISTGRRDVVIVSGMEVPRGAPQRPGRMKLLQFCENHRPAYWGTWSKTTATIRPRRPWAQDKSLLDYEVDSDEEWEEEEPGESLSHSEGDEDDDGAEDEDDDDGFFVPHGYLSEDEGVTEESAGPGNHEVLQKLRAQEWAEFLAKGRRVRPLQPVVVGCVWADTGGSREDADLKLLKQFAARLLGAAPPEESSPKNAKREKRDQQILAQLLPLLHGNVNSSKVIIREFQEHCRRGLLGSTPAETAEATVPSKARLKRLISQNSVYEKRPDFRMCWYVHTHVLRSFRQEHLPVPCQWSYITAAPTREECGPGVPPPLKRKAAGTLCITQFMKKSRREAGPGHVDGFQADTEDEDETACLIVDAPGVAEALEPNASQSPLPTSLLSTS